MDYRERWELKDYLIGRTLERRILLFHIGLALLLLGFLLNFWYLQGVNGATYASLAEDNRLRRIPIQPTRGEIYDRNRQIIASTRPSLDLLLRREGPHDLDAQLERLAGILGQPPHELHERLEAIADRPDFEPLLVREDIRLHELAQIEARRELFPSVEVRQGTRRHYPESDLVSHAVGYVGQVSETQLVDSNGELQRGDIVGKSGIERSFDTVLRGDRGLKLVSVNNLGRQIGSGRVERPPGHGRNLAVTIDLGMQQALKDALDDEAGAGVFLDPRTGEVLAMASTPSFDPNLFADGLTHEEWQAMADDPRRLLHDRAIASFYAPGSTFKVVMAVAGLETGTIQPTERAYCNGSTMIYKRRRLCWKRGGHGWVDLRAALAHSCNVYFYHLGKKLGIDPIHDYGGRFGLGELTGIDVPGEERGILPSREWKLAGQHEQWYPGDTISVAIGQGLLAVTPVQMATMMAAVATGARPRPHLRADLAVESVRLDVAPGTLDRVRRALEMAVNQGTGREATLGAFSVAGKTGTAQVFKHSAGIDSNKLPKEERDHAWFVGYAPADDPRIAFAVIVEHGGHGGSMAAPIARKVLEVFFAEPSETEPRSTGELRAGRLRRTGEGVVRSPAAR
jgi:penicillin-binding protein 2